MQLRSMSTTMVIGCLIVSSVVPVLSLGTADAASACAYQDGGYVDPRPTETASWNKGNPRWSVPAHAGGGQIDGDATGDGASCGPGDDADRSGEDDE